MAIRHEDLKPEFTTTMLNILHCFAINCLQFLQMASENRLI